ncbi:OsmC family protein [Elioraea sp.]|uniref:OsmC family protein n=1 Tax=Elioraea sp. TaxID=2185103 RepID=UPI003F6F7A3E
MAAKTRTATVSDSGIAPYGMTAVARGHSWAVDEPGETGGKDSGPEPFELLCGALGACTAITVRMYAGRKAWPLERIAVTVTYEKPADTARFSISITLEGPLDQAQRERLLAIAGKCPVHQTLAKGAEIVTAPAA